MTNLFTIIYDHIEKILKNRFSSSSEKLKEISIEVPKNSSHGDIATNAAMVLASYYSVRALDLAKILVEELSKLSFIESVKIAGPGFINIIFKRAFFQDLLKEIVLEGEDYGVRRIEEAEKVHVEFVSADPTGPLHVGHTRGAIYGDALCNLLERFGYNVTREYYINDAGGQIDTLIQSFIIRYQNLLGENKEIPEGCYPGEYLISIAKKLIEVDQKIENKDKRGLVDFVVSEIMNLIKTDLCLIGVRHNVFRSEYHDIISKNKIQESLKLLEEKNLIYIGTLENPKFLDQDAEWEAKEHTIFRSTAFEDDSDRAVLKSDGSPTYFAGDIAYHFDKIQRGFKKMVLLLGADHSGYLKRIKAAVNAIDESASIEIKVNQLVNLMKDGKPFKMSKREGNALTISDILSQTTKDNLRFAMLLKKNDTVIDIDFSRLNEQSKDNPIFYVQYANARANSVLRKVNNIDHVQKIDTSYIVCDQDIDLIKMIATFPKVLSASLKYYEPHRIAYYLLDLATSFHQLWSLAISNPELRFIIHGDEKRTQARILLVKGVSNVISSGLKILGIEPLKEM